MGLNRNLNEDNPQLWLRYVLSTLPKDVRLEPARFSPASVALEGRP